MAPGSILNILIFHILYFDLFNFCSYTKNTKNIKLSYLSELTFVSDRKGIDNPLSRWLRSSYLFVQVRGTRAWSPTGLIPWLSKLREILTLLCRITLSSSREYNASSRSSKKNFWRRCWGGLRKSHIPSTYHKPLSFALHFLHLVFLSSTSPLLFYLPFFCRVFIVRLLLACLCVACLLTLTTEMG